MDSPDFDAQRDFANEYGKKGESELLRLAGSYDTLVDAAQDALRAEFAKRKMEPPLIEEPGVLEGRGLITIRRYRDLSQAIVPRSALESAGIFCFLQDENFVRIDWGASNAVGGIRLQNAAGGRAGGRGAVGPADTGVDRIR